MPYQTMPGGYQPFQPPSFGALPQQQGFGQMQGYAPQAWNNPYAKGGQAFDPMQVQGQGKFPALATSYGQLAGNNFQPIQPPVGPQNPANMPVAPQGVPPVTGPQGVPSVGAPPVPGGLPVPAGPGMRHSPLPPGNRHSPQEMAAHLLRIGRGRP